MRQGLTSHWYNDTVHGRVLKVTQLGIQSVISSKHFQT